MAKHRPDHQLSSVPTGGLKPDQLEVIARARGAAFATDENQCISIWNKEAEALLGYRASQVLGKRCHEILCGFDLFGNRFCTRGCVLASMAERREPVHHFELDVHAESGEMIPIGFSIVVLPGARTGQYTMIHFMERVDRRQEVSALIHRILTDERAQPASVPMENVAPSTPDQQLTSREIQVLRLLAEGTSTQDIATSLYISVSTTRNHVQNILRKLDVHSKLEAVSLAIRTHLL